MMTLIAIMTLHKFWTNCMYISEHCFAGKLGVDINLDWQQISLYYPLKYHDLIHPNKVPCAWSSYAHSIILLPPCITVGRVGGPVPLFNPLLNKNCMHVTKGQAYKTHSVFLDKLQFGFDMLLCEQWSFSWLIMLKPIMMKSPHNSPPWNGKSRWGQFSNSHLGRYLEILGDSSFHYIIWTYILHSKCTN